MTRHRVLVAFGIAWLAALLVSWWVYHRMAQPASRDMVQVVAAARELPVGHRVAATDLKVIALARKDLPAGFFARPADVVDRAVVVPVGPNEPLLDRKLAAKQGGEGLTAMIEPGKRAMTVQVNETTGVAGFVQPGSRVDVVFTRMLPNGDAASTTILQNVPVLAYGRNLQRSNSNDSRGGGPSSAQQATVTLLVTQDDAEKLALALQRGKIQLALRNPLDETTADPEPIYSEDLGIEEPVRAPAGPARGPGAAASVPAPPPKPPDPKEGKIVIRVYRGSKVSEEVF